MERRRLGGMSDRGMPDGTMPARGWRPKPARVEGIPGKELHFTRTGLEVTSVRQDVDTGVLGTG